MSSVPTIEEFESKGWYLSLEGIQSITAENEQTSSLDDYIRYAKDLDLSLITSQGFNKTNEKIKEIPSPVVLQLVQMRNIATPSTHASESPRLLQATLTDGHKKWKAIEIRQQLDCLKLHTPPGTKFLVTKPIPIQDQILLLEPGMLKELGGHVQELVQAWRAGKQFLKRNRNGKDKENQESGPPAFVPFKVKPKDEKRIKDEEPNAKSRGKKSSHEGEKNKKETRDLKAPRQKKGSMPEGAKEREEKKDEKMSERKEIKKYEKPAKNAEERVEKKTETGPEEEKKKKSKRSKKKSASHVKEGEENAKSPKGLTSKPDAVRPPDENEKQSTREPRTRSEHSKKDATRPAKEDEGRSMDPPQSRSERSKQTMPESPKENEKKSSEESQSRPERSKRNRNKNRKEARHEDPATAGAHGEEQQLRRSERLSEKKQEGKENEKEGEAQDDSKEVSNTSSRKKEKKKRHEKERGESEAHRKEEELKPKSSTEASSEGSGKRERLARKAKRSMPEEKSKQASSEIATETALSENAREANAAETAEKSRQRKPKKKISEDSQGDTEATQVMKAKRKPRKERVAEEGSRVSNEDGYPNTRVNRRKQYERRKESQGSLETRQSSTSDHVPLDGAKTGKESQSEQTRGTERPRKQKVSYSHTGRKERKGSFKPEKTAVSTPREERAGASHSEEPGLIPGEGTPLNTESSLTSPHTSDPTYGSKVYDYSQQQQHNPYSYTTPVYAAPEQTNGQNGYYYSSQPYSMADYNMMVPVYHNAAVHQGVYGYSPVDPQQQQYMQPVYYQQPYYGNNSYQPYYNHQSYYNADTTNQHHSQKQ